MELKKIQMKKKSETKAVREFNKWHNNRLNDIVEFDNNIFEANLNDVKHLSKEKLEYAICRFIPEIKKLKSNDDYPGKTLYEMCVAIQKYQRQKLETSRWP